VLWVPLVALLPLHPPEATHAVAFVEVHVSVAAAPLANVVGEALKVAVGDDGAGSAAPSPPPPHAARNTAPTPGQTLKIRIGQEANNRSRQRCDMNLQYERRLVGRGLLIAQYAASRGPS
jgi:hypothetical protein